MGEPAATADMLSLVRSKRILISVGSGGVGKTTVAASLGLLAARASRRTLVMTIDPARRLATSLGLTHLGHEEQEVPADKVRSQGVSAGLMHAMMLDTKRAFDDMVHRYAPDPETAERVIRSKLYRQISSRLAGSQEYAAMEKLHAIHGQRGYDLLVLDTPPTANALDFLDAPRKMVDAVESPAINLFVRTYRKAGRLSLNILGFGAAYVVRRLARFTGGDFLDDIAAFLTDLSGLLGGMHDRAAQVIELLSRDDVGFVIVTSPDPRSIDEAIGFRDRLERSEMRLAAIVINRVHPLHGSDLTVERAREAIAEAGLGADGEATAGLASLVLRYHGMMQVLAEADAEQIQRLRERCGDGQPYVEVPLFDEDIHDIRGLARLAESLY